jgi:cytosine/uracil/thiamine/allantoin permease
MNWLRYVDVQNIKAYLGLSTLTLAAFLVGVACLLAALMVGVVYNVQNFGDFQAVQFWRVQWLLGAVAAFVAGILLKQKA